MELASIVYVVCSLTGHLGAKCEIKFQATEWTYTQLGCSKAADEVLSGVDQRTWRVVSADCVKAYRS